MKSKFKKLAVSLAIPYLTAIAVLAIFGFCSISCDFFASLKKPFFFPSKKFFCISWGIVCVCSGFASFRVWNSVTTYENRKNAISSYVIQTAFYLLWALVFFGLKEYYFALFWFFGLLMFSLSTIKHFSKIDRFSGRILIPQIAMTVYTGYLNLGIALLN